MKNTAYYLILILLFSLTACSSDDDNGNINNNSSVGDNEITFDISGAVEGNKSGSSYVIVVGDFSYIISNNDGTSSADQTFSLAFHKSFDDNNIANPTPGTYPIGTVTDLADVNGFWVVYTDTRSGEEFGGQNVSGTMTITSNNNNQLKGTFEFSAGGYDTTEGTITVTNGSFSAAID